jgi:hypothetical protein
MYDFPLDIFIVFKYFDLNGLLSNFVLDAFLLEIVEDGTNCFVETCGDVEEIDLPPDLLDHGELLLHS